MDPVVSQVRLAQAYVPFQIYAQQWPPMVALERGTVFPELYSPYEPQNR